MQPEIYFIFCVVGRMSSQSLLAITSSVRGTCYIKHDKMYDVFVCAEFRVDSEWEGS